MVQSISNAELNVASNTEVPTVLPSDHHSRQQTRGLSFELCGIIIKHTAIAKEDLQQRFRHLHNYARVCYQLSRVVLRTPELWSKIVHPRSVSITRIALKLSREAPLEVICARTPILPEIFTVLLPVIYRVKVFKIKASLDQSQLLLNHIEDENAGHILEKLSIIDSAQENLNNIAQIFVQTSTLRQLRLSGLHIPLDNIHVSPSLTQLALELHPSESTTFGPYFRFLSLLPALVELRLTVNRSLLQPIAWPHDQAITPTVLLKLEKLELLRLPGHTTAALLRSIESQSCQKIRVRVVGIEGFRDLRVSSFTMETAVSKVIASPALIEITMKTENTLEIEVAREAEQKLSLVIESHHGPSEFARSLLTDVEHSQVTTLKLSGRKLGLAQSVASHLPDFLSLKELYLADIRDSDAILIALAESHNAQKWICPKLTSLDLKGTTTYDKQKLIYMLQYRYEDQSLRGSNPSDPTPMHLHKLALNYRGEDSHEMLKKEYMEKLESIIGADSCEFAWNRDRNQDGRTNGLS